MKVSLESGQLVNDACMWGSEPSLSFENLTLKGTAKARDVDVFKLDIIRGTKPSFFKVKGTKSNHHHPPPSQPLSSLRVSPGCIPLNIQSTSSPCADPVKLLSNPCVLIFFTLFEFVPWNNCRSLFASGLSLSIFCLHS